MDEVTSYADEHEGGQLRIVVAGEQVSLLPLDDSAIPTRDEPQAVDELPGPGPWRFDSWRLEPRR